MRHAHAPARPPRVCVLHGERAETGRSTVVYPRLRTGRQVTEPSEGEPIDVAEDKALRRVTPQHIDLMTEDENFGVQRNSGPEQPSHNAPDQPAEIDHRTKYPRFARHARCFGFTDASIVSTGHRS